jgi:hypothetical protein
MILGAHPRELLIALPKIETDLYRVHQLVWQHVANVACSYRRPIFIYRIDGGMIRVRSHDLPNHKTSVAAFRPGSTIYADLSAVRRTAHGDVPVSENELVPWCTQKFVDAGYRVDVLKVLDFEWRHGTKGIDHIKLPVARVEAKLTISDASSCLAAWENGIGRGKRFGLGMLAH